MNVLNVLMNWLHFHKDSYDILYNWVLKQYGDLVVNSNMNWLDANEINNDGDVMDVKSPAVFTTMQNVLLNDWQVRLDYLLHHHLAEEIMLS